MGKSCYDCEYFALCRLRDRAKGFAEYVNETGNLLGDKFSSDLYALVGSSCSVSHIEEARE